MTLEEFGKKIQTKYPEYADLSSEDAAGVILKKHPVYASQIDKETKSSPTPDSAATPSSTISSPQQEQNPFKQGLLGGVLNFAPGILGGLGAVAGAGVGGLVGVPTGPGAVATGLAGAGIGGAAGAAAGEGLKQMAQNQPNPQEIINQAGFGALGGLGGQVLGGALGLAGKLPIVRPAIQAVKDVGENAISKLFGPGELKTLEQEGTKVPDLVKRYNLLDPGGNLNNMGQNILDAIDHSTTMVKQGLQRITQLGLNSSASNLSDIIDNARPSGITDIEWKTMNKKIQTIAEDAINKSQQNLIITPPTQGPLLENEFIPGFTTASGLKGPPNAMNPYFQDTPLSNTNIFPNFNFEKALEKNLPINPNTLQDLKQAFYNAAKFQTPIGEGGNITINPLQQAFSKAGIGIKDEINNLADKAGVNISQFNQDWKPLNDIADKIQTNRQGASNLSANKGLFATLNPLNSSYGQTALSQGAGLAGGVLGNIGKFGPALAGQLGARFEGAPTPGVNPTTNIGQPQSNATQNTQDQNQNGQINPQGQGQPNNLTNQLNQQHNTSISQPVKNSKYNADWLTQAIAKDPKHAAAYEAIFKAQNPTAGKTPQLSAKDLQHEQGILGDVALTTQRVNQLAGMNQLDVLKSNFGGVFGQANPDIVKLETDMPLLKQSVITELHRRGMAPSAAKSMEDSFYDPKRDSYQVGLIKMGELNQFLNGYFSQ